MRLFILLALLIGAPLSNAYAEAHAQSAFLFADRGKWGDARAHAKRSNNTALKEVITWMYSLDQDSGAEFGDITDFINRNPDWPKQETLRLRAEQSLRSSSVSDNEVIGWFRKNPPVSGYGKIRYAEVLERRGTGSKNEINALIHEGWRDGDFEENEEERIEDTYAKMLDEDDHVARVDRLIWEEKYKAAARLFDRIAPSQRTLARARIALLTGTRDATTLLSQVSGRFEDNPGLIYARMVYRASRGDEKGVRDMLLAAPKQPPYPEKWWRHRETQVREAINEKRYDLAKKLISNHGQTEGVRLADALWLAGWLECEFLNDPHDGYLSFYKMYETVKFPVSKARAAYWAGRAAEKTGDKESGKSWYETAAAFPSTFYGQLASALLRDAALKLPAEPKPGNGEKQKFKNREMVRAAELAADAGKDDIATQLINHLIDSAKTDGEAAMAAELGVDLHSTMLGVRGAKRASQQKAVVLRTVGYPMMKVPGGALEPALAHAVARQESEFDPKARSRAGALGLMQLLPSTAKEVARKAGMPSRNIALTNPATNVQLGSLYLGRLINAYDGSYILGIAAYNAGPGRVRQWLAENGSPAGKDLHNSVNWIEEIPFAETRNYVQRVLENLQVYRHLLQQGKAPPLGLKEDLLRG